MQLQLQKNFLQQQASVPSAKVQSPPPTNVPQITTASVANISAEIGELKGVICSLQEGNRVLVGPVLIAVGTQCSELSGKLEKLSRESAEQINLLRTENGQRETSWSQQMKILKDRVDGLERKNESLTKELEILKKTTSTTKDESVLLAIK